MPLHILGCRKVRYAGVRALKVGSSVIVRAQDLLVHIGIERGEGFPGKRSRGKIACPTPHRASQVLVVQKLKDPPSETVNIFGYEGVLTVFAG